MEHLDNVRFVVYFGFGVESPSFIFGSGNRKKNKRNNSFFS